MLSRSRASLCIFALAWLAGCSADNATSPSTRCPAPTGEFPPDGCAIVSGRVLRADGSPAANTLVSIDTTISERNFRLLASERSTDRLGRFSLFFVVAPLGTTVSLDR